MPPGNWYYRIRETSGLICAGLFYRGRAPGFDKSPCIVENVRCEYGKVLIDGEAPIPNSNSGGGDPGLLLPPSSQMFLPSFTSDYGSLQGIALQCH